MAPKTPIVSISMITYNHEKHIEKAIESVLMQKTNFTFELIISDDCSIDNTASICTKYLEKYPSIIKVRFNDKNTGFQKNHLENFKAINCKYVAYLEGDDYWTDENKLQKQYDFMETHPGVAFCYTNSYSFNDGNEKQKEIMIKNKPGQNIFDLDYYINNGCFIMPALTLFIRKDVFPDPVPEWLYSTLNLDWALNILYLQKGKAAYLDEITAMYRIHSGGIILTTYTPKVIHNSILLTNTLDKYFNYKYHRVFGKHQGRYHQLTVFYFEKKKYLRGFYWLFYSFFRNPKRFITDIYLLKTLYKVTFTGHEV